MRVTAIAFLLVLLGALSAVAEERSILLLTPTAADGRVDPSHEAIRYWNEMFVDLRLETRLGTPHVVVESPVARA